MKLIVVTVLNAAWYLGCLIISGLTLFKLELISLWWVPLLMFSGCSLLGFWRGKIVKNA